VAAASVFNVTSGRVVQYSSTRLKRADLVPSSADAEPTGTHASRLVSDCRPMQGAYTWRPSGRGEQQPHRAPVAHTIFFLVGGSGCMAVASKLQGTTIVRRSQDTELHREGWILINPMVTVHRLKKKRTSERKKLPFVSRVDKKERSCYRQFGKNWPTISSFIYCYYYRETKLARNSQPPKRAAREHHKKNISPCFIKPYDK